MDGVYWCNRLFVTVDSAAILRLMKESHPGLGRLSFATTYHLNGEVLVETMRTAFQWSCRLPQLPPVIIIMIVGRPEKVGEGHVRDSRAVPSRYCVRGANVNSLVDPDIDHIVSHYFARPGPCGKVCRGRCCNQRLQQ